MSKLTRPIVIGAALQIAMVVTGHYAPGAQQMLYPVAGTLIGALTGWLTGPSATAGSTAGRGAIAGCVAGVAGSVVCIALGDAPVSNLALAGTSTLVAGALGALARRWFLRVQAP
jgi:hypothetical protein